MLEYNFSEDKNTMVITTKNIINNVNDIVLVFHDEDDGIWEFLDGEIIDKESAAIVSLFEIVKLDNSVNDLCGLPLGGRAYRNSKNEEWIRCIN